MKIVYKLTLLISIAFCNVSCSQKGLYEVELPTDIQVDSFLFNHFPKEICTDTYSFDSNTNADRNNIAFFLKYSNCSKNIDSLTKEFEKKAIEHYNLDKECLLIANSTETKETLHTISRVLDSLDFSKINCDYTNKIPVPNINMYFEGSAKDYEIYIFEAKKGEHSKLYKFDYNKLMPSYWNHGYSKGVAFSKTTNDIIYWGCMW